MTVEVPKERQIKDNGTSPHNLPYSRLLERMQGKEEIEQHGVLMLKPGCFSVDNENTPVQDQTENLFSSHDLDIIATSCITLSRNQIHQLYPNIFELSVKPRTSRLAELRPLLEDYLSDCVFAYLVRGEKAQEKLQSIKEILRQDVEHVGNWDVENRVHVPGEENLNKTISLLFNHENCSICSKDD